MGWSDWLSIAGDTVDLISRISKQFGDARNTPGTPVNLTTLSWTQNSDGTIVARNNDINNAVAVSYNMIFEGGGGSLPNLYCASSSPTRPMMPQPICRHMRVAR